MAPFKIMSNKYSYLLIYPTPQGGGTINYKYPVTKVPDNKNRTQAVDSPVPNVAGSANKPNSRCNFVPTKYLIMLQYLSYSISQRGVNTTSIEFDSP
jgi:hypothetical protein